MALAVAGLLLCLDASAQSAAGVLTLEQALTMTLEHNPDVLGARAIVDVQRGAMVQAGAPFDPKPQAAFANSRMTHSASLDISQVTPNYTTFSTASTLGLDKLYRTGVAVSSSVSLARTSPVALSGPTLNQLAAISTVTVPLMQGRSGGLALAGERAAAEYVDASAHSLRAVANSALFRSAAAYWQYRAAYERAAIQRAAVERSSRMVRELEILIQADERPRSDIDLMAANAASKRVAQIQAEQQIFSAWSDLALVLGRDARGAALPPEPTTGLPDVAGPEHLSVDALITETLAHHDDLAAALERREGARLLRDAATAQLRPRVDLVLGVGFSGQLSGGNVGYLFGSLFNNVLGPNVSTRIVFAPSATDSDIRGAIMKADAQYVQAAIEADALKRSIELSVAEASAELDNSRAQLHETDEAVTRSRLALETVQRDFELGAETLFDRILAEDTLTNAQLADLSAHLAYASAVVKLQLARGVLVDASGDTLVVQLGRVMRVSPEE